MPWNFGLTSRRQVQRGVKRPRPPHAPAVPAGRGGYQPAPSADAPDASLLLTVVAKIGRDPLARMTHRQRRLRGGCRTVFHPREPSRFQRRIIGTGAPLTVFFARGKRQPGNFPRAFRDLLLLWPA